VHPDPDINPETESALRLIAEPGHLSRDLQPGLYRTTHIVVVRNRMTEYPHQPIPLGGADQAPVLVYDPEHLFAVPPYHQAIRLGLHLGRQRGRIHQIGKENDQP
jgi:hypothetical protein